MKKVAAVFLSLIMISSLAGCFGSEENEETASQAKVEKEEVAEESFDLLSVTKSSVYDSEWCREGLLYTIEYENLELMEDDAEKYPRLYEALCDMNESNREIFESNVVENKQSARDQYDEGGYMFLPHYDEMSFKIVRADEVILSALETNSGYWGGMHPYGAHCGINFDSQTGKALTLDDVSTDRKALEGLLYDALMEKYGEDEIFFNLEDDLEYYIENDYLEWTIGYRGITFYFSPYALASYAEGLLSVEIPFEDYAELFNEKYLRTCEYYSVQLLGQMSFDLDSTDGKTDDILCYTYEDEYEAKHLRISINDRVFEEDNMYCYDADVYLMHFENDGDNKNYIYAEYTLENDYRIIGIYEINGDCIRNVEYMNATGFMTYYDGEYVRTDVLNDPYDITLETRCDMLSTMTVYRDYHVDVETGEFIAEQDYYDIDFTYTLTSLIDMELDIIGEDEPQVVEAGEEFTFIRTDNDTYVDMKLSDGRECRLWVDISQWPYTVNGMNSEECFEGMMYAG